MRKKFYDILYDSISNKADRSLADFIKQVR